MVDLLAAVPSIVFGLWGIFVLAPWLEPVARFLNDNLGWFFLFADGNVSLAGGGTIFTAGIVLAVMILPIITVGDPRGLQPHAQGSRRGRAGVGRHQVGSGPDDRLSLRPQWNDRRVHARARPCAR